MKRCPMRRWTLAAITFIECLMEIGFRLLYAASDWYQWAIAPLKRWATKPE